jgi:hypothetical protein
MNLTKNVMQLNNISVGVGKRITFEDVTFDDSDLIKYNPPANYVRYRPTKATKKNTYADLMQTYKTPLNIGSRYDNGAKYLYVVCPCFRSHTEFDGGTIALGLAASSESTTAILDISITADMSKQDLANGKKIIRIISVDEAVVKNVQTGEVDYDMALCEMVLDLKTYYDKGVRHIWIPRTINETVTVNGYSVTPVNTIEKPVAYFIYEN